MAERNHVGVRLADDFIAALDRLAVAEHRTRSDMVRVLLIEAIEARHDRAAVDDGGPSPDLVARAVRAHLRAVLSPPDPPTQQAA